MDGTPQVKRWCEGVTFEAKKQGKYLENEHSNTIGDVKLWLTEMWIAIVLTYIAKINPFGGKPE